MSDTAARLDDAIRDALDVLTGWSSVQPHERTAAVIQILTEALDAEVSG